MTSFPLVFAGVSATTFVLLTRPPLRLRIMPKARRLAGIASLALLSSCAKYDLDRKMMELCGKDGGIHVYETIKLPQHEFDEQGRKRVLYETQGQARREDILGPEYRYIEQFEFVAGTKGNISEGYLNRMRVTVQRRSDGKVLGEGVSYYRVGGDGFSRIVNWHPTSNTCPKTTQDVINSVFIRETK